MATNKYKSLLSDTFMFAIASFGTKFINFFMVPLFTNALTTAEYGTIDLINVAMNMIIPFATLSINDAVIRFGLNEKYDKRSVIKNAVVVNTLGSILIIVFSPLINRYSGISGYTHFFVVVIILNIFRSLLSTFERASNRLKLFAFDSIIYTFTLAGLNILFVAIFKKGISGYYLAMIISQIISIIILFMIGDSKKGLCNGKVDAILFKQMVYFSVPMILNAVSWAIFNFCDRAMIKNYIGIEENGLYSAASKIPSLISVFTLIFTQSWSLSAIREFDTTRDKRFYENVFNAYSALLITAAGLIMIIAKPFMLIYVGPDFRSCWKFVPFLLMATIYSAYSSYFGSIYTAAMKNVMVTISTVIAAITNILLNFILIQKYGTQGAALATMLSYMVLCLFRMFNSRQYFSFHINYPKVFASWALLCILSVICIHEYQIVLQIALFAVLMAINQKEIILIINKSIKMFSSKLHI